MVIGSQCDRAFLLMCAQGHESAHEGFGTDAAMQVALSRAWCHLSTPQTCPIIASSVTGTPSFVSARYTAESSVVCFATSLEDVAVGAPVDHV